MTDKISTKNAGEKFPFIKEIENQMLPAMVTERKIWVDLKDHILQEYWHDEYNARIFKIFSVFFNKYHNFPTEEQCLDIANRKKYDDETKDKITEIYETIGNGFTSDELEYLYDESKLFIKNNKIKVALLDSVDELENQNFLEIEKNMKNAVNWNPEVSLGIQIIDVEERQAELKRISSNVIPSPWKAVNQTLGGGFYGKELTLIASSSSVGKSIALDNIGFKAWEDGFNVVSITLELSEARKAQRMDAAALRMSMMEIENNGDKVAKFYKNLNNDGKLFIKEFPTGRMSMEMAMNYLYQLELYTGLKMHGGGKDGINVLLVDYLDIGKPNGKKSGDSYVDQGSIGEEMRAVGQELDIPVISATQFNRGNIGLSIEDLNEGYLADSWKKMGTADTLIGMANTAEERTLGKVNFKFLKNRNGVKDIVLPMKIIYEHLRITDISKK